MRRHELTNNTENRCFEFHIDGQVCVIDYSITPAGDFALTHTGIPANLRGQGIGSELVESVLEYIEGEGMKVVPLCGFVVSYIEEHPEWDRVVSNETYG